ncbi:hypothetical protein C2S53_019418 [Perilla frutescens var. hirtella]|uniref:Uncharacterized protein n=1 Tax=Perilla frutescens var. hirtella TaxID=608512 RepID=A0AAD4JIE7_PERFH|nr:hypothetical protein C2S53_019418 [Perilla frutescens var. hirtella]
MKMQRGKTMKVKKGWLAVQVGVLDKASELYDYRTAGPLMLPCSVEDFLHLQWRIQNLDN